MINSTPVAQFLNVLYGERPPGFMALWTAQDKNTLWIPAHDQLRAEQWADELPPGKDGYFGIGLHPKALANSQRGKASAVIALPGLWVDIDIKGPAHKKEDLPGSLEEATDLVRECPMPPTLVVDSGHGLHVWWLFHELWSWSMGDFEARGHAQDLAHDFQAMFCAMAERHMWHVDSTSDLARVLRVPGTNNWKLLNDPAPVRILEIQESCRYSPSEFEAYLGRPQRNQKRTKGVNPSSRRKVKYENLDIVALFKAHDQYGKDLGGGKHAVVCPWESDHTEKRMPSDSDTVIWESSNGQLWPQFCCLHGHCYGKRGIAQVIDQMGDAGDYCSGKFQPTTVSNNGSKAHTDEGMTKRLADAVLETEHFALDVGGKLYCYERGRYVPFGERRIKNQVKAILKGWLETKSWTAHRASEVVEFIRVDSPLLWERPLENVINVKNGLLDLATRELKEHSPEHLSTVQLNVAFDPAARCPAWENFISGTFPTDAPETAWEIIAWVMTPDTSIQKAVLLMGEGGNGKSAFLAAVQEFLGSSNVASMSLQKIEGDRFSAVRLLGKMANICADLPSTHLASTSTFKAITGGDAIPAEYKFQDGFDFRPFVKLLFSANHAPRSGDASHAFFRRWVVIPFEKNFEMGTMANIPRKILDCQLADPQELSGALNNALVALPRLRDRGFTVSPSMVEALGDFRQSTDPIAVWLDRNTVENPSEFIFKFDLCDAYNANSNQEGRPWMNNKAFGHALKRVRPNIEEGQRTVNGVKLWAWIGMELKTRM